MERGVITIYEDRRILINNDQSLERLIKDVDFGKIKIRIFEVQKTDWII